MKYFKNIKENDELQEALFEIPASFLFVLIYFVLFEQTAMGNNYLNIGIGSILFIFFYYLTISIIAPKAKIHVLPVISFIYSLIRNDFATFLYRLPGQFLGALMATLFYFTLMRLTANTDFSTVVAYESPFLTGMFCGFIAQLIYFSYFFLVHKLNINYRIKSFLLALCLGLVFILVSLVKDITLLNPFGFLFQYLLSGNALGTALIIESFILQILIPMVFIIGTHFFVTGYKNLLGYTQTGRLKE